MPLPPRRCGSSPLAVRSPRTPGTTSWAHATPWLARRTCIIRPIERTDLTNHMTGRHTEIRCVETPTSGSPAPRLKGHMDRSRNGRTTETRNGAAPAQARAKQRAYIVAALESGDDLSELRELLATAGVAVVGQAVH